MPDAIGPYEILGELGRGGMGVVYKARRSDLQRDFALKVIAPGQDASGEAVERFRREAQAAGRLTGHPGIVGVHDIGEAQGRVYFAMDFVDGASLEEHIDGGEIPVETAVRAIAQAARAVHHAHEHGILHRDIKPGNIMLGADGQARVADFGLAKSTETDTQSARLTKSGAILGTPAYMPPEQADGEHVDRRVDVYALGATLFECLADRPPFESDSLYGLLAKIQREDPPDLCALNPRLPRPLAVITTKCLEKPPERRYQSAAELADDLERWLAGDPIAATAPSLAYRGRRWMGRHKALTAGVALGLIGLGAGAAWFVPQLRAEQRARESAKRRETEAKAAKAKADAAAAEAARQAAEARARQLAALRKSAKTALQAVIALRQAGATERTPPFVELIEADVREVSAAVPDAGDPHYWLGRVYRAAQRDAKALQAQEAALQAEPAHAGALYERAVLLAGRLQARLGVRGGSFSYLPPDPRESHGPGVDDARTDLAAALQALQPGLEQRSAGEAGWASGLSAWMRGDRPEALRLLQEALGVAPELPEIAEWLAALQQSANRWLDAEATLVAGLERDRGYLRFWIARARCRNGIGEWYARNNGRQAAAAKFQAAIADYAEARRREPQNWRWPYESGRTRLSLAQLQVRHDGNPWLATLEAAIAEFDAALACDGVPEAVILQNRGLARMQWASTIGDQGIRPNDVAERALADFAGVLEREPDNGLARMRIGAIRMRLGLWNTRSRSFDPRPDYAAAESEFRKVVAADPGLLAAWSNLGAVHVNRAIYVQRIGEDCEPQFRLAVQFYTEAVRRSAGAVNHTLDRARCYGFWMDRRLAQGADLRDVAEAGRADYERVIERAPQSYAAWRGLADLNFHYGGWLTDQDRDGRAVFKDCIRQYLEAQKRYGRINAHCLRYRGGAYSNLGRAEAKAGNDPTRWYRAAVETLSAAIKADPEIAQGWRFRGNAYALWAQHTTAQGENPRERQRLALRDFTEARRLGDREVEQAITSLERALGRAAGEEKK